LTFLDDKFEVTKVVKSLVIEVVITVPVPAPAKLAVHLGSNAFDKASEVVESFKICPIYRIRGKVYCQGGKQQMLAILSLGQTFVYKGKLLCLGSVARDYGKVIVFNSLVAQAHEAFFTGD